ncbi:MAG: hypothetical protein QNK89_00625 [Lacinutrix sp.]|uniref:hypothetical protein n=1 Tax=Lacinutrix sp. TaxID=1937692 RepID=UPI0030A28F39
MKRLILIFAILLLVSCQTDTKLFDDIIKVAAFDRVYKPTLIQSGKENGYLEPTLEYSLFKIDSLAFQDLENSIATSEWFKKGRYYLNIELDEYLYPNNLDIMSKYSIFENHYDKTYQLYLLSDKKLLPYVKSIIK